MKKIVFVTNKMVMGGIEKAMIAMLNSIDKNLYEVTVLLMEDGGDLKKEIPDWVNIQIISSINQSIVKRILTSIKNNEIFKSIVILLNAILSKINRKKYKSTYYYIKTLNYIGEEYDLAISYHTPLSLSVGYVIENIKAKKKIAYIHSDMDQHKNSCEFNKTVSIYNKYYKKYDRILCVSKDAKNKFIKYYPNLQYKTDIFYNIIDEKEIHNKSLCEADFEDSFYGIRIVTVGRLSIEKGQMMIPKLVKKLLDNNIEVRWYCIGDGKLRKDLEELIHKLKIENNLILLGIKKNPYPFIRKCDIYVQTSIHEGYCITLAEAKVLNKPILTTDFVGAKEQINNNFNGLIVNRDEEDMYESLVKLIKNKDLREKFEFNLKNSVIDNKNQLGRLYEIIENEEEIFNS